MSRLTAILVALLATALIACGDKEAPTDDSSSSSSTKSFDKRYVVDTEPTEHKTVRTVLDNAKTGEEVTVFGRIKDFVNGRAVFTLIDRTIPSCIEEGCDCPTPWDFC